MPTAVVLFVDLTPGVAVAHTIIARLDRDGDGLFSPGEAEAYGRALVADLDLTLDGLPRALSIVRVAVPAADALREGQGTIEGEARAEAALPPGRHRLILRNSHLPEKSVYLANALVPDAPEVRILQQTRDVRQQTYELDFEAVDGRGARTPAGWLLLGTVVLSSPVGLRASGKSGLQGYS